MRFLWYTRQDSNLQPPGSKPGTLSSWATGAYLFILAYLRQKVKLFLDGEFLDQITIFIRQRIFEGFLAF